VNFTPALIANLLANFGLPLVQQLYALYKSGPNTEVTPEQFDALMTLANYRSADALAAAGIRIVDGAVVKA
jgi:hypothetical protein